MKQNLFNLPGRLLAAGIALAFVAAPLQSDAGWGWWRKRDRDLNLVEKLQKEGNYTVLLTALELTGLKETVATAEALTIFAPTDEAFLALPDGVLDSLIEDPEALSNILLYHVVAGAQKSSDLLRQTSIETLQGNPVIVAYEHWQPVVNGQPIRPANLRASNGFIHSIGAVLLPPAEDVVIENLYDLLEADGRFTTLLVALGLTGLDEAVKNSESLTIFAPTDDAFAALPEGTLDALVGDPDLLAEILLYHVLGSASDIRHLLSDGTVATLQGADVSIGLKYWQILINDAKLISPNMMAPNGILQVIDGVLLPPTEPETVIDLLTQDGRFTTLLTALELTGLTGALEGEDPLTVFAPTDAAFAALPKGTLDDLIANPDALKEILLYHVVAGDRDLDDLRGERSVETLLGQNVHVWNWNRYFFVNRSYVLDADLTAGNGRVHAIYRVLIP